MYLKVYIIKKAITTILVILYACTLGYSNDFSPSQLVSEETTPQNFYPDMAITDDGKIYVVWVNTTGGGDIYFSKSTNHGATFSEYVPVNQSPNHASSIGFNGPKIAERNDTLHVLWSDERNGYSHTSAFYARSVDGGVTWEESQVGHENGINLYPELMVDSDGVIHAVFHYFMPGSWSYRNIEHTRSTNGGDTWSDFKNVSNYYPGEPCDCCPIELHQKPDGQIIAGFRNNHDNIRDIFSMDWNTNNNSWVNFSQISYDDYNVGYCPSSGPSIVSMDSLVAVVYMTESGDENRIFLSLSEDYGDTFSVQIPIDTSGTNIFQNHPSATITNDRNIHLIWEDSRDNGNILYGELESGNDHITNISTVNDSMTNSQEIAPSLGSDEEGYLYAVWVDCRYGRHIRFSTTYPLELSGQQEQKLPNRFLISNAYPNPFNPTTTLRYDLADDAMVTISIYDLMGRSIRLLVNRRQTAGYRFIQWDATNNLGEPVSAGMYLYTIQAGDFRQTKKMVLLK